MIPDNASAVIGMNFGIQAGSCSFERLEGLNACRKSVASCMQTMILEQRVVLEARELCSPFQQLEVALQSWLHRLLSRKVWLMVRSVCQSS